MKFLRKKLNLYIHLNKLNLKIMKKTLLSFLCLTSILTTNAQTTIVDVTNPVTGETWMDRNLGATQAATSTTDAASYGDYYQWGRGADGHQISISTITNIVSTTSTPGHGDFIVNTVSPHNWFDPSTDNLWQGVNGINNPCPTGYRIPTIAEFEAEKATWSGQFDIAAFNSILKLPLPGVRSGSFDGSFSQVGQTAYYYTSDLQTSTTTSYLAFNNGVIGIYNSNRANGMSCRCIKDITAGINTQSSSSISIYPNPTNDVITIKTEEKIEKVQIFSITGELVQTEESNSFSINQLNTGVYIVDVKTASGIIRTRIIKN